MSGAEDDDVGAGASGAAIAWRLARAGLRITCREQGGWVSYADVPSLHTDWEIARQTTHHPNPNIRRAPVDYPIDESEAAIKPLLSNAVGGSTGPIGTAVGGHQKRLPWGIGHHEAFRRVFNHAASPELPPYAHQPELVACRYATRASPS